MVVDCFVSPSICYLSTRKGKTMRKLRSNKRQHNNLYAEKSLLLERKNLSQPLKYKKDVLSINKTTPKSKSAKKFSSHKCNELTKISKQKIHTTIPLCEFHSVRSCKVTLEKLLEISSKTAVKFSKNNSENVQPSVSPEFKKQQDNLNEKTPCIPKKLRLRSSNTIKQLERPPNESLERNESPNGTARSSRRSMRSQSQALSKEPGIVQLSKLSASPEFKKQQSFLNEKTPCMPKNLRRRSSNKIKEHEGSKEPGIVQLSKLSASPEFKKQKNILNEKTPCMPKNLRRKSSNKLKKLEGQSEVHHNTAINISGFINESPKETARSSRRSMKSQSQAFLSKEPSIVQLSKLSASPEFKKQQNILNDKTPCMPKKLRCKSSDKMKEFQEQNEVHHNTAINVSGFINESPNETARSPRRSMRSQSQALSKEPSIVQLSKLSASPEFKKQQNIVNNKTPCMPKKLRCKSSDKVKEFQEQNEVHHNTAINVSGFINESPNETARSPRRSMRSQSQALSKEPGIVQLSKLSASPEFKKQQNILNNKTPCMPKKLRCKSSDKVKEFQEQNEVHHNTAINVSGFINESPNETARSPRRSMRSQSQALSKEPGIVQLSKLSASPELKKQQNILNDKTPCIPKKLRSKSSDKMKKLQEQNELYKTIINVTESINESPNETSRSAKKRKSKRLQPQGSLKKKSDNVQLSKHLTNSTMERKAKELMTPNRKSNKHAQKNTPSIKKRCVQKSSEKLQNKVRPKSCINFPIDELALSPFPKRQAKSDGHKLPGKNTLKRKRFILETMKEADVEYEDDIYEEREFNNFVNMLPDTSDSELSYSIATPRLGFSLTPQIRCKTPPYKDCFSPAQYALSRKIAEEYFYRNKKRKSKSKPEIPAAVPEKKKIEFDEILENACKVQKEAEKLNVGESDCEDNYFTDD